MNQTKATSSETRRERKEEEMTIVRVLSNTIPFLTEIDHRSIATRNLHSKRRQKENIDHTDRKKRELTIARKKKSQQDKRSYTVTSEKFFMQSITFGSSNDLLYE